MDRLTLRPSETADALGISRSRVYELLARGELPSIKIGSSIRVPVEALREWLAQKSSGADSSQEARG